MRRFQFPPCLRVLLFALSAATLSACGGGSSDDEGGDTVIVNDSNSQPVQFSTSQGKFGPVQLVSTPGTASSSYNYPNGFFSLTIKGLAVGETTTLRITLPAGGTVPTTLVKCINNVCADYPASISGTKITLRLTDGGNGDADGVANGVITDPVAPAVNAGGTGGTGGTGGSGGNGGSSGSGGSGGPPGSGGSGGTGGSGGDLLRVGAAKRSITPTQAQIDGIEEPRAFGLATHVQQFNLGGFGVDPFQNFPDPLASEVGNTLTEPASRRLFTNSQGVEEHTYVRALVIEQPGGDIVAFVMIDAIGAGNVIQKNLKSAVINAAGTVGVTLKPENILFGQTHSHAAADLQGLWGGVPQQWINEILYTGAAAAVKQALQQRKPARLSMRQGSTVEFNNYRRPRIDPDADADGTITLLTATGADNSAIGSILQYNAHPTSIGAGTDPRTPHGEYILGAMEWIENAATGPGGVGLYYNGPIADASGSGSRAGCAPVPADQPYSGVRCRGEGIALAAGSFAARELSPSLSARSVEVVLPVTNPLFLAIGAGGSFNRYYDFTELPVDQIPVIGPQVVAGTIDLPQLTPVARTFVSRITLGGADNGLEIVTIPGETTNTFGQYIRSLANTNVMLMGLTHNSFGYIIPEEEFSYIEPVAQCIRANEDPFCNAGLLIPFTGYEEFVSLGPLTAPMLRIQGYNPLFDAPPDKNVPPEVAACSNPASEQCVLNRIGLEIDYIQRGYAALCRAQGGPEEFCSLLDPETPLAAQCRDRGYPDGICSIFGEEPGSGGGAPTPIAATSYGTGVLGAVAELVSDLNEVIERLLELDLEGVAAALQVAINNLLDNLSGLPDDAATPGTLIGLGYEPDATVAQALSVNRAVEPVVLTGAQLPGWSQPAATGISQNHFSGFENLTGATEPGYGPRDAHAGIFMYPPNWTPGDASVNQGGVAVEKIAAYAYRNGGWKEIPVQVDERYPYFLANGNSTFSFYSGIDIELSYAWDTESWGMTKGICKKEYDPAGIDVAPKPGIYTPLIPGADPNRGVSKAIGDPIAGLDNDDEIVFMAGDAGEFYQGIDFPAAWQTVQLVRLNDPLSPAGGGFVYLVQKDGGSSFNKNNGYVKYQRHANADQWIDRSFFENGGIEQDIYKRNALGTSNTGYGPNLDGTVCNDPDDETTARLSTAHGSEGGDRFPRDGVVVSTDTYRWEATGRWMLRDLRVREPSVQKPDADYWADHPDRDLVDRWKGRAFQQSPDSTVSVVGFEDEQVNWEANSSLLGERCGPVRCMREVWGADSGTNVTKIETFYRDAIVYRYHVRVHPIPPDGLYTSWDYNRSAMVPNTTEMGAGIPGGRYYTMLRPQGVPIDGVNDDIGQMDTFPGCRQFYESDASGTLLPVLAQITDGVKPATDNIPFVGTPDPYDLQTCAAFFDAADPTFNLALGFENWEQVSAKGNLGSLVYIFEMTGATSALNPLVVPYYRDDACLDDGTGDDPVWRPWPGESYAWNNGEVGKTYNYLTTGSRDGPLVGCDKRQGAYAAHGIHYFFTHDTDNAMTGVTSTEIDGQQWQFMVPTDAPRNIAEPYANTVRARLIPIVIPMSAPGGGGWIGDPGLIGINPDTQCGSIAGQGDCLSNLQ